MSDFITKLKIYVKKYCIQTIVDSAPHFKYNETTYISPEIALELYSIIEHKNVLLSLYEKETDYNRFLRQENQELKEELESMYMDNYIGVDTDDTDDSDNTEEKYLS